MTDKMRIWEVPSTGINIVVPPISLVTIMVQVRRNKPEPEPPIVDVTIAGVKTKERRHSDPAYIEAYKKWEQLVEFESTTQALYRIAAAQKLTDDNISQVELIREINPNIPGNNTLAWFLNVAIGNDEDIANLIQFATGQGEPQQKRIEATANGF